ALETMAAHGNDLQAPATRVAPAIDDAIDALGATTGAAYARMSGSGATCFATFGDAAAAEVAAAGIAAAHPLWWVVATVLR
ncbi:MAG: 4-(cytidine 5'-diphospho)-2-C-methyl-D-erythritol kinase, partial [Hyphomicrobiales bacterium]|nr:4-(cytidine 5'-diphospho)-2-C-methyl-D-erythritol kinase [Hyphomicrobiales bacterium]